MLVMLVGCRSADDDPGHALSLYAGDDQRQIKALSSEKVLEYLQGEGMGLARVAELNHYPGPRHVIDLADQLELSDAQRGTLRERLESMRSEAVRLGRTIVDLERELDSLFAEGEPTEEAVVSRLTEIAQFEGRLRFVHVREHLHTRSLLSAEQVERYDHLRGYSGAEIPPHEHGTAHERSN
jgi:hypothetical protein